MKRRLTGTLLAAMAVVGAAGASAQGTGDPPARPGVDAPELARLGGYPVGVTTDRWVQPGQADPLHGKDAPEVADRVLPVTIWYPAAAAGRGTTYRTALSGEDAKDVLFTVPGLATPSSRAAAGRFPLVILAHGYGNTPEVLSWLGENLASKGYVVVAPAFRDPPISIRTDAARAGPIARRPLDVAFVTAEAQRRARLNRGLPAGVDPERVALIGYSMGGYGVLTAAGAPLNPAFAPLSRNILAPYATDPAKAASLKPSGLRAVVAISPAVKWGPLPIFTGAGAGAVAAPTLFIAGTQDHVVGYDNVRTLFEQPAAAPRYFLSFKEAGHSIGLIGAPPSMRRRYWDQDWFEDSVWRKDRLLPVELHFITAFLDRYVKDDAAKVAYLDGLVPDSDQGKWANAPIGRYAGYSPGPPTATIWKGFQPSRAVGMMFEARPGR